MGRCNSGYRKRKRRIIVFLFAIVFAIFELLPSKGNVDAATASETQLPVAPGKLGKRIVEISVRKSDAASDRTVIQEALNQSSQYRDDAILKIVLEKGTYHIDSTLYIDSNTWIYAEGATIINDNDTDNTPLIANRPDGSGTTAPGGHKHNKNIFISGGTWDGNKNITTSYNPIMMMTHCSNVIIAGATFQNSVDHMLNLSGSELCLVQDCTFKDQKRLSTNSADYFLYGTSSDQKEMRYMCCEVLHLDFMNNEGEELGNVKDGTPPENITINGCTFTNVFSGIGTHHPVTTTNRSAKNYATGLGKGITIKSNTFSKIKGTCIIATSYTGMLINGNTAANCGRFLYCIECTNSSISGSNKITGCWQGSTPYEQHQIDIEKSNDITISGVTASAGTSYAENYNLCVTESKNITLSGIALSQAKNYAMKIIDSSAVKVDSKSSLGSAANKSINIENSSDVTINGNTLTGSANVSDSSATFASNTLTGGTIYIKGGTSKTRIAIKENTIKNSDTNGVTVQDYKGSVEISKNSISRAKNHAVLAQNCGKLDINNNSFSSITSHVINFESVTDSKVMSNTFGTIASGKRGLRLYKSSNISIGSNNLSAEQIREEETKNIIYYYADSSYTGVTKYSGSWYYVKKGIVDQSFTGFTKYNSKWYYVEKGFIPLTTTYVIKGTVNGTNALWYVKNNVVTYTNTVAKDKNGNYYGIINGKVDNNFNGFLSDGKEWWHVNKGKVTFTDTGVFKGTINGTTGWYYAKASKYTKATVLAKNPNNNTWWRVTDGKMDFGFTGFFENENGLWYCKNGQIDFGRTGLFKGDMNGTVGWYYVEGGKFVKKTTLAKNPANNTWWRVTDGKMDFGFTGFFENENGLWYCKNGQIDFSKTGLFKGNMNGTVGWYYVEGGKFAKKTVIAKNPANNTWWRVTDGKMDFGFTGFFQNDAGWWYCKNGQITFTDTGIFKGTINGVTGYYYVKGSLFTKTNTVAQYGSDYWCVQDGMINSGFTGICSNSSGSWYCKDGKAQLEFTGEITYNGKKYKIVKGMVK